MSKHTIVRIALSLIIIVAAMVHSAGYLPLSTLDSLDSFLYDQRLTSTMPNSKDPRVVVVDIDEESLAELGRWPWPRKLIGEMITNLFDEYGVAVVGFDVLFAEPDRSSGLPVLERLAADQFADDAMFQQRLTTMRPQLQYDRLFAEALKGRNVVMGFAASDVPGTAGALPPALMAADDPRAVGIPFVLREGVTGNLPILQQAAASGGYFDNALVDPDGIFRRLPLVYEHDGKVYQTLSLAMYRLIQGNPSVDFEFADEASRDLEALRFGSERIPVGKYADVLVPYRGGWGKFNYVRVADVIKKRADPKLLKDTLVLIGSTAAGLMDLRATPVGNVYPGVEVHANVLSGMLDGSFKQDPSYAVGFDFLMLLALGLVLAVLLPRLGAVWSLLLTFVALIVVVGVNVWMWEGSGLSMPMATQLVMVLMLFVSQMLYSYFVEARSRRQMGKVFGQYVPPEIVEEMSATGKEDFALDGDNRNMSVLFSDVRGFTTLSEGLEPTALKQLMNALLTPMTAVIHDKRGTIDKYMGDAIMAFWGAPLVDQDHASHAVDAGLGMLASLDQINKDFEKRGWPSVAIGVGVNTGPMNVGNMGSEFRMAYTVLGDAVNLGSRLEGLTKHYGVSFIVSEYTKREAPGFVYRDLDKVTVKGKNEPVTIFAVLGRESELGEEERSELKRYHNALALYRKQRWDEAEMNFSSLSAQFPDTRIYAVYLERIPLLRTNPPGEDWDAVFEHTSK